MYSCEALQWFVGFAAMHSADVRGKDSKGTAGINVLKALKLAHSILHFPAAESVLNSGTLACAASPHAVSCSRTTNDGSDKAHMSVDAVLVLQDIADDRFPGSPLPLADCSGAKGKSFATVKPFSTRCPIEGFTGEPLSWLSSFYAGVKGLPYMVEGFKIKSFPSKSKGSPKLMMGLQSTCEPYPQERRPLKLILTKYGTLFSG